MNETTNSSFQFKGYRVVKSLIEIKSVDFGEAFNISFKSKGEINKADSSFQLELSAIIKDKKDCIHVEVEFTSSFVFDSAIEKTQLKKFFYINAPAILFPYIRAYITTLTALSGIDPINLPTLNLSSLGKELEENTTEV